MKLPRLIRLHAWVWKTVCSWKCFQWLVPTRRRPIINRPSEALRALRHSPRMFELEPRKAPTALGVSGLIAPPVALLNGLAQTAPSAGHVSTLERIDHGQPAQTPGAEAAPLTLVIQEAPPGEVLSLAGLPTTSADGPDTIAWQGDAGTGQAAQPVDDALSQAYLQGLTLFQDPLAAGRAGGKPSQGPGSNLGEDLSRNQSGGGGTTTPVGSTSAEADPFPAGRRNSGQSDSGQSNLMLNSGTQSTQDARPPDAGQELKEGDHRPVRMTLTSSDTETVFGESVTFKATVEAPSENQGTPTGTVTFKSGETELGSATLDPASHQATWTTADLHADHYTISAHYSGDDRFRADTSEGVNQEIDQAATSTTVTGAPDPSHPGDTVTITATVSAVSPSLAMPAGTVTFLKDGDYLGTGSLQVVGNQTQATVETSELGLGSHLITATYDGNDDGDFLTSSGTTTLTDPEPTMVDLTVSPSEIPLGGTVTFTATVSPTNLDQTVNSGTVIFKVDGNPVTQQIPVVNGIATTTYTVGDPVTEGSHQAQAYYFDPASVWENKHSEYNSLVVGNTTKLATTTTLSQAAGGTPFYGQPASMAIHVTANSGGGVPGGDVKVVWGKSGASWKAPLSNGYAYFPLQDKNYPGTVFQAFYLGNSTYLGSSSDVVTQAIAKANTTTSLKSLSGNSPPPGNVTFEASVAANSPSVKSPQSGTVQFQFNTATYNATVGSNGKAYYTATALPNGTYTVTAKFLESGNYNASPLSTLTVTVKSPTSTSLAANPPATTIETATLYGSTVTLTAAVTGFVSGAPGGTVTIKSDGSPLPGTPSTSFSGTTLSAVLTVTSLPKGSHTLTAEYTNDNNYASSTSAPVTHWVKGLPTTTTVTSSVNPSSAGAQVTITATVSGSYGAPTGVVSFYDNNAFINAAPTYNTVGGNLVAELKTSTLGGGSHTIKAQYGGNTIYATSYDTMTQSVSSSAAMTLSAIPGATVYGEPVTLSAMISSSGGIATGTVTFKLGGTTLGTGDLIPYFGKAVAQLSIPDNFRLQYLTPGSYTFTADFPGGGGFAGCSGTGQLTVNRAPTSTTFMPSVVSPTPGQPVTLYAGVSVNWPGSGTPTGEVTFRDYGNVIPGSVEYTSSNGVLNAQLTLDGGLTYGPHSITASYGGSTKYVDSTSSPPWQQTGKGSTTTLLSVSPTSTPVYGQPVTLTAAVTGSGAPGTPTGAVTFKVGGQSLGTGNLILVGGQKKAVLTVTTPSALTFLQVGSRTIVAEYAGDAAFAGGNGILTLDVQKAVTAVQLTSPATSTSIIGQEATFTATVSVTAPGAGTPGGQLLFRDNGNLIPVYPTVSYTSNSISATLKLSTLALGDHTITAYFTGGGSYAQSTSATSCTHTVYYGTSTTLQATPGNWVYGQTVSLTATVEGLPPASGSPTGSITILDNGSPTGLSKPLTDIGGGKAAATITYAGFAVGNHSLVAVYNGDGDFIKGNSAAVSRTLEKAETTVAVSGGTDPSPSPLGQSLSFTAVVSVAAPGAGVPTGTVTFYDSAPFLHALGTRDLTLVGGQYQASITLDDLGGGYHYITGLYDGDSHFKKVPSSAGVDQWVTKSPVSTTLASSVSAPVFGQPLTLTATFSTTATDQLSPSGVVTFYVDETQQLGTDLLTGGGGISQASITINAATARAYLGVGAHTFKAVYDGDGSFIGDTPTLAKTVVKAATTTTILPASVNTFYGQTASVAAFVSAAAPGSGVPTGTVSFSEGSTSLGDRNLNTVNGVASTTFNNSSLGIGTHNITATYNVDGSFTTSSASFAVNVQQSPSKTTLLQDHAWTGYGESVTFTVKVEGKYSGGTQPTGQVTVYSDGSSLGTLTLSVDNTTGISTATVTTDQLPVGTHTITVSYPGDTKYLSSLASASSVNSLLHGVGQTETSLTLSSSSNPSVHGQPIALTATLTPSSLGETAPTGQLHLFDGALGASDFISSGNMSAVGNGTFRTTFTISSDNSSSHNYYVAYLGDSNYSVSYSSQLQQVVNQAATTITLSSSVGSSAVFGQTITFTAAVNVVAPGSAAPTGAVIFSINGTPYDVDTNTYVPAAGYIFTKTITPGVAGPFTATAQYYGDLHLLPTPSGSIPSLTVTVNPADTSLELTSSAAGAVTFGQPVTFTAKVTASAPSTVVPTGSVTFYADGESIGTQGLSGNAANNVAVLTATSLPAGWHTISAKYNGTANFKATASPYPSLAQQVLKSGTSVFVWETSDYNLTYGLPAHLSAVVKALTPGSGLPTGTVTFKEGSTTLPGDVTYQSIGDDYRANLTVYGLKPGSHYVTAIYGGDDNFIASSGKTSGPVYVSKIGTTISVASSMNPSKYGQPVTFTASVSPSSTAGGALTGTVIFRDNGVPFGTPTYSTASGNLQAIVTVSNLGLGFHTISAQYGGNTYYLSSNGTLVGSQYVEMTQTTTTVSSSANPSKYGQSIVITALVEAQGLGVGTPAGTVEFKDGGAPLTGVLASSSPSPGKYQVTLTLSSLSPGDHTITAQYLGNTYFVGSGGSMGVQHVDMANTTTTVTSSANPSKYGQSVTFTAVVKAQSPGSGIPNGTVVFKDGGVTLSGNPVTDTSSGDLHVSLTVTSLSLGNHTITAEYQGNTYFIASNGGMTSSQHVDPAGTVTQLQPTAGTVLGQQVTFTAVVSVASPGAGTPSGTVTFFDNGSQVDTPQPLSLVGGQYRATLSLSTLTVGLHPITAQFNPDSSLLAGSASPALNFNVGKAPTSTALTSDLNPAPLAEPVTFTATVSVVSPGAGELAVNVTNVKFYDGSSLLDTRPLTLVDGTYKATLTTSGLSFGSHTITAVYQGDSNFALSTSDTPVEQAVGKANSTTTVSSSANPSKFGQEVTLTATVQAKVPGTGVPTGGTGDVVFKDGSTTIAIEPTYTTTAEGFQAAVTVPAFSLSNHTITAEYGGDGDFQTSVGTLTGGQQVQQADTNTVVDSTVSPSKYGQPITLTAVVSAAAPGAGTPSGTVTFKDGGATITGQPTYETINGQFKASLTVSSLSAGGHTITAEYSGDTYFTTSTGSLAGGQQVGKAETTTGLVSSGPSVFGQEVTFTVTVASVSPSEAVPGGSVTFYLGGASTFTDNLTAFGNEARVTFKTTSLAVGSHTVTAHYAGTTNFLGTAPTDPSHDQVVAKADTTTTLQPPDDTVFGETATFTAVVAAKAPGAGAPSGTVTFLDGNNDPIGTPQPVQFVNNKYQAKVTISTLAVGSYFITARYDGDGSFNLSSSDPAESFTVSKAETTTELTSETNPSPLGQDVTFTATVSVDSPGAGVLTLHEVTLLDGTTELSTQPLALVEGEYRATFLVSGLSFGTHQITARYNETTSFNESTSAELDQVVKYVTQTSVSAAPSPSVFGQEFILTAEVSVPSPGTGTPTGTVSFLADGKSLGSPQPLVVDGNGHFVATLPVSSLVVATYDITASYSGNGTFYPSTSDPATPQEVQKAETTTTVSSDDLSAVFGQPVTFTATVSVDAPGAGTPTGDVWFFDGTTYIGTGHLNGTAGNDQATFATSSLSVGSHTITAVYQGDSNFNLSDPSNGITQVVDPAPTTTTVTAAANPAPFCLPVTLTATVAPVSPATGLPTTTVDFYDGAAYLGTATIPANSNVATLNVEFTSEGEHSLTAVYDGDGNYLTSTSAPLTLPVEALGWDLTAQARVNDPHQATQIPFGPALISPQDGDLQVDIPLDLTVHGFS